MTMPYERTRAVLWAEEFLKMLAFDGKSRSDKTWIKETAKVLLRHYPNENELNQTAEKAPELWARCTGHVSGIELHIEPLQRPGIGGVDSGSVGEEPGPGVSEGSEGVAQ